MASGMGVWETCVPPGWLAALDAGAEGAETGEAAGTVVALHGLVLLRLDAPLRAFDLQTQEGAGHYTFLCEEER